MLKAWAGMPGRPTFLLCRPLQAMAAAHWQALLVFGGRFSLPQLGQRCPLLLPSIAAMINCGTPALAFDPDVRQLFQQLWEQGVRVS